MNILKKLRPVKDFVDFDGSIIASPDRRYCGPEFKNNLFYVRSSENEAKRLIENFGIQKNDHVVDIGCGQGRLPIGLLRVLGNVHYTGLDIDKYAIQWCKKHIERINPSYHFEHLDLYNERYNNKGKKFGREFLFDMPSKSVDVVYLFSVFSHTTEEDMRTYLRDFKRILKDGGGVFFTTFVEEGVPDFEINPPNYKLDCDGPLHVVRYEKSYLMSILGEYGYEIQKFSHSTEVDGQSGIYLRKGKQ